MKGTFTTLSQEKYDQALAETATQEEALECLLKTGDFRTLPEKLMKFYDGQPEQIKLSLKEGFKALHPEQKEREAALKGLTSWFKTVQGIDDRTISRKYAFEICFISKFDLEKSEALIKAVTGEGIHYRSVREFVLAYALNHGLSYGEWKQLAEKMEKIEKTDGQPNGYTSAFREISLTLQNEEELNQYIVEHAGEFGEYRHTAHAYLMDMLDILQNEGILYGTQDDVKASVDQIVQQNLYRCLVQRPKGAKNAREQIQKSIFSGWPEESQLSKMRNQESPVTRKVLILLFLASGGGLSLRERETDINQPWDSVDDIEQDPGDADFETMYMQLNAMLTDCGFMCLDPRCPFDWMILFVMATGDVFDFDERFEGMLQRLFGNEQKTPEDSAVK